MYKKLNIDGLFFPQPIAFKIYYLGFKPFCPYRRKKNIRKESSHKNKKYLLMRKCRRLTGWRLVSWAQNGLAAIQSGCVQTLGTRGAAQSLTWAHL